MSKEDDFSWCLKQAIDRYLGTLSEEQIKELDSVDFPWLYYEDKLDELGIDWVGINPNGIRYKDIKPSN